nr:ferritin heavy chain-like [Dasypus novemcinctus]
MMNEQEKCLNQVLCLPVGQPPPAAFYLPVLRSCHRCSSTTPHDHPTQSQVLQSYTQNSEAAINRQINLELNASYVFPSMSHYFDHDDVALKNFAKYFLHPPPEERQHAEKLTKLQNQRGGRIFLGNLKKPEGDGWESGLDALHLEKRVNQSLLELHKLATDKNNPHLCDFTETHYLKRAGEVHQRTGWLWNQLVQDGVLDSGLAEYLFDRPTLGSSDDQS